MLDRTMMVAYSCILGLLYLETVIYGWHERKQVECILFTDQIMSRTRAGVASLFLFETHLLVVQNYTILPDYGVQNVASSWLSWAWCSPAFFH